MRKQTSSNCHRTVQNTRVLFYWRTWVLAHYRISKVQNRQTSAILLNRQIFQQLLRIFGIIYIFVNCSLAQFYLYFISVCNIQLTDELCKDDFGYNKFVEPPHNCVPRKGDPDPLHTINEAKKSFMSGHSSFSFYCATFLVIYLHARLSKTTLTHSIKKRKTAPQGLKVLFRYEHKIIDYQALLEDVTMLRVAKL